MTDVPSAQIIDFKRVAIFGPKRTPIQDLYADMILEIQARVDAGTPIERDDFHGMFWMLYRDPAFEGQPILQGYDPEELAKIYDTTLTPEQEKRRPLLRAALEEIKDRVQSGAHVLSPKRIYAEYDY